MTTDAVILARVSSTEQEYGKSLDGQLMQCREYAERKGLKIIKEYRLVESSTRGGRKEFMNIINFVKAQHKTIAIIVHTVDRLQRRFEDTVLLRPMALDGQIELHFVANGFIVDKDTKSHQKLMWNMNVMGAEMFIDQLKENTKRGLDKKIEDGEWPTQAPLGYLNHIDENRKKWIILDPERAPLIKRLFEEYSTGAYNIRQMHKRMKELGLRHRKRGGGNSTLVSKNTVYRILEDSFYCGTMVLKKRNKDKSKIRMVKHHYETLITEALFERCKDIRLGRKKKSFQYGKKPLIFRGLIRCGCGRAITPYIRKGKYTYLKCTRYRAETFCTNGPVREEVALAAVTEAISKVKIDKEGAEAIRKYLEGKNKTGFADQIKEHERINKALAVNKQKRDNLLDIRLGQLISDEQYKAKLKELEEEKTILETQITEKPVNEQDFMVTLDEVLYFLQNAAELFKSSQLDGKRIIISTLLANLVLQDKKVNFTYRKPFNLFVEGFNCPISYRERDSNPHVLANNGF